MQRRKMHRGADIFFAQRFDEGAPVNGQALELELNDVEMPGMLNAFSTDRCANFGEIGEPCVISFGDTPPRRRQRVTFFQLFEAEAGCNIGEIVFVTDSQYLVIPRALSAIAVPRIVTDTV